jgi:hypothetical protein
MVAILSIILGIIIYIIEVTFPNAGKSIILAGIISIIIWGVVTQVILEDKLSFKTEFTSFFVIWVASAILLISLVA